LKYFLKQIGTFVVAGSMFVGGISQAAIVTNGGFESGGFDGWEQSGPFATSLVGYDPDYGHTGDYAAFLGEAGGVSSLSQQIETTVGQTYSVKFWLGNLGGSEDNTDTVSSFAMVIDGALAPALLINSKTAAFPMLYDISFVASTDLTKLEFAFRHDELYWALDDVSVNAAGDPAPVPEPGTLVLLAGAVAAWRLTGARRARSGRGA
jgi:hypothetical protein